jgi:hypothetical protein
MAGIVFISTPHFALNKNNTFEYCMKILKATVKKSPKVRGARIHRESAIILDLAERFEGISIRSPVLSIYEKIETKTGFGPFRSKFLVGPYFEKYAIWCS